MHIDSAALCIHPVLDSRDHILVFGIQSGSQGHLDEIHISANVALISAN